MKDRLVFEKTKSENIKRCPDCHLGLDGNCQKRKSGLSCMECDPMYNYKLVEEPEEIQTEYDWKKERFDLFEGRNTTNIENAEYHQLRDWLKNNKPEKFETCTKENTKNGDTIKFTIGDSEICTVEHIFLNHICSEHDCVVKCGRGSVAEKLSNFVIDLYKDKE